MQPGISFHDVTEAGRWCRGTVHLLEESAKRVPGELMRCQGLTQCHTVTPN